MAQSATREIKAVVQSTKYISFERVVDADTRQHVCFGAGQVFDCPQGLFKRAEKKGLLRKATGAEVKEGRALSLDENKAAAADVAGDEEESSEEETE